MFLAWLWGLEIGVCGFYVVGIEHWMVKRGAVLVEIENLHYCVSYFFYPIESDQLEGKFWVFEFLGLVS